MAEGDRCESCSATLPKSYDRTCTRCGWDNMVKMRKCVKCKDGGAVSIHEPIGYGPITGGIGIGGLIGWRITSSPIVWVFLGVLGSLCGLITMATLGYKCGLCGKRAEGRMLSRDEKNAARMRRLAYLIGSIVLAVGSGLLALLILGRF